MASFPRKSSSISAKSVPDPVLRNALRYTISAREYALLHRYVLSRSRLLRRRMPSVETVNRIMNGGTSSATTKDAVSHSSDDTGAIGKGAEAASEAGTDPHMETTAGPDDYNARAVRQSVRLFAGMSVALKLWEITSARLTRKNQESRRSSPHQKEKAAPQSPALRLSLSLSTIFLLYRLLFRFFARLRVQLLEPSAAPFRNRNPYTARTLTSRYAPAIGASVAGLALGVYPARQLRVSIAIYALFRALEFGWNAAEDGGMVWGWEKNGKIQRVRPWWWGSWMLQPLAFGQLLHAVVFDRDCFPPAYGEFIFKRSTAYIHSRPKDYPPGLTWPSTYDVVDSLAQMARLNWPPFISPTLFPHKDETLPPSLAAIEPLSSSAHPLITSLSCATLHPSDPSCSRTFLTFWLRSFPPFTRFFMILYSAFLLPRLGRLHSRPVSTLKRLVASALRMSVFVTGSIGTAWTSVCFFENWFPRSFLPTQRFFLGGFLAGLWAIVERRHGRGVFLYSARTSIDSLWKVGVKRRWWRAMKGGDVWLFVLAVALTGVVYEKDARAVREQSWRKGISWVRGEGWRDWALEEDDALAMENVPGKTWED